MAKGGKSRTEPNGLKRLEDALVDASKRGPFSKYLRREFEEFSRAISKGGPRWDVIAEWAKQEGHTGGKPIKPATAKRAYEREKKRRERVAEKEAAKRSVAAEREPDTKQPNPVRMLPVTNLKPSDPSSTDAGETLDTFRKNMRDATTYGGDKK